MADWPLTHLTDEQADRLAQELPPYPPPSETPAERCPGRTGWHRPLVEDWNAGNRESACTWCQAEIARRFGDPTWREVVWSTGSRNPESDSSDGSPNPTE